MSSFGQNLVCTNLTCSTINGNAPSGGSSKWTDVAGTDNIERGNGDVIVKDALIAENATINDKLVVENAIEMFTGGIQAAAGDFTGCECINLQVDNVSGKSGTIVTVNSNLRVNGEINNTAPNDTTNLDLFGNKTSGNSFINLNTAGVDETFASTIYFVNFEKKPDDGTFFRINMSGDIIGARNVALQRLTLPTQLSYKGCQVLNSDSLSGSVGSRSLIIPADKFICFCDLTLTAADVDANDSVMELTFDTTALSITTDQINNRKFTYDISGLIVQDADDPDDALLAYNYVKDGQFVTKFQSGRVLLGQRINFTVRLIEIEN